MAAAWSSTRAERVGGICYQKNSNLAGVEDVLQADTSDKRPMSVSPDGRLLLYLECPDRAATRHLDLATVRGWSARCLPADALR